MSRKTSNKRVPRLRFPEFRNAGEWEERELAEIADIKLGKMLDKKKHRSGRELPYLHNLAVRWNTFDLTALPRMYFTDDEIEKFGLVAGDVVVCEGGEPGRSAVWDDRLSNIKFQKALHRVRFKIPFLPHLLVHYLETISGTTAFQSLFTGGGIKHLTRETFSRLIIPFPASAEQQKIAECLGSLDDLIGGEERKLSALRRHKQGLMQQLFPRQGQSHPQKRFPEFRNAGEWEEKRLGEVAEIVAGQSPEGAFYNETGQGLPFYQGKTDFGGVYLNAPTKWTSQITKTADAGDILMSVRAPVGAINVATQRICIGRGLAAIRSKENNWFIYYLLLRNQRQIVGSGGSVFDSISRDQIMKLKFCFPRCLPEQQKIAECLGSLDDLIAARERKLSALRRHKQGLMQQLFPSAEGM